jgi:hypothetical protein
VENNLNKSLHNTVHKIYHGVAQIPEDEKSFKAKIKIQKNIF